ncbi:trypsin-like peptidase domain-containing protein [Motiliproteus sediminis]|uniref:trypsin-like peptidase domain-containing protein n=1 Tax=Motiliproteus sediminis TaxID=1468178 RepID=UPI001AF01061|nr:trypsin-like peptidase domain-containing protein [Motiliproteus sediminis]
MAIDRVLLTTTPIQTFAGQQALTNASGFFFANNQRLFLVTCRHVLIDADSGHHPDRIEIELHIDPSNATQSVNYSIPLYHQGTALWRQGEDSAGAIDVAVIEIDRSAFPKPAVYAAFGPDHLHPDLDRVTIGTPMLIIGFPLGFHDTLHHLPVARQAINASSFSLRFQGSGYFLTDARTHRGSSGAMVVMRNDAAADDQLPWWLMGVHSARLDVSNREEGVDEALGLNCAWFADILLTLTR